MFLRKRKTASEVVEQKSSIASQLVSPSPEFLELFGGFPTASGAVVSPLTATRVPAVRAAVMAISEALGQIEAHVYTTGPNAKKATDHPAYALLHDAVNPWTSASAFREQLTRDALLFPGGGFASISRDPDGDPIELTRMQPDRVAIYENPITLEPSYRYSPLSGELLEYSYRDVLHLRAASYNGITGDSPIVEGREAIGLALTLEAHANRLFANGARPSGVITLPGTLVGDAITRIKASLQSAFGGSNSGGTMVLEQGAKFEQTALSSSDAQFLEMRDYQVKEIARVFRVNPILLAEMGRATFANAAETGRQFIQYTLQPWVTRWQGEIALKLLTADERGKFRIELDTDGFDQADFAARMTAYSTGVAARIFNPNECRAQEGYPPYGGGEKYENPNTTTGTDIVG